MDNGTNLSKEQINSILSKAKELTSEGKEPDINTLSDRLSPAQSEKIRSILNNPEKLREIMNSPMAKKLMGMLNTEDKE